MSSYNVQFIFTRHGYSCANVLTDLNLGHKQGSVTPDAILSDYGIVQAKLLNGKLRALNKLINPDIVVCSNLKRAIETAMYIYKDIVETVYPVSFISEIRDPLKFGLDYDNVPSKVDELKVYFKEGDPKVDFDILEVFVEKIKDQTADFSKFIKYVVPYIIKHIQTVSPNKNHYVISVVSHQHFIEDHLNIAIQKIFDNKINEIMIDESIDIEKKHKVIDHLKACKKKNRFLDYLNIETWIEDVVLKYDDQNNILEYNSKRLKKLYSGFGKVNSENLIDNMVNYVLVPDKYEDTFNKIDIGDQQIYERCMYHPGFKDVITK